MGEIPPDRIYPQASPLSDPAFQLDPITYLFESFRRSLTYLHSKVSYICGNAFYFLSLLNALFL